MSFTTPKTACLTGGDTKFLTDGGFETTMLFHEGFDLPAFCASVLLDNPTACQKMRAYFDTYLGIAEEEGTGFVLDTNSWRAGPHWASAVGVSEADMLRLTREAIGFAKDIADDWRGRVSPILVNGVIGPAGDGYSVDTALDPALAEALHRPQIAAMAGEGADMVSALTMTHVGEAVGLARAAVAAGLPVVISFTVETDGCLPDGTSLVEAIAAVDRETDSAPLYFMVNCAHPTHFEGILDDPLIRDRIGGIRANASKLSHAELDVMETLDDGDPQEFGTLHTVLQAKLPNLRVIGGCCGSDDRHVACAAHLTVGKSAAQAA